MIGTRGHFKMNRRIDEASIVIMLLAITAAFSGCNGKAAISPVPNNWVIQYTLPQKHNLGGIWGSSGDNIFVVGEAGTILHYNGKSWSVMDSGTTVGLEAVWGSSPNDVFAVGGIILHYDGHQWSTVNTSVPPLNAIWGSSSSNIFAVGYSNDKINAGSILHYDGKTWDNLNRDFEFTLRSIWGDSASDVFAVGDKASIEHYDGKVWHSMDLSPFISTQSGTNIQFNGVWGTSPTDLYIVGNSFSEGTFSENFFLLHYDGQYWTHMPGVDDQFYSVWGSSSSNVFLAGIEKQLGMPGYYYGVIQHYYGNSWNRQAVPNSQPADVADISVNGVWGSSSSDVFAVDSIGDILHYSGN